jgi:prepilin-type N-terminal cleavage/methylation domain-containing protein
VSARGGSGGGFTLIESLVALVLVSAVLMLLAPPLFHVANERIRIEGESRREAVLRGESNRLASLPFEELDDQAGCTTVTGSQFSHERCITVSQLSPREREIKIKVMPSNSLVVVDSVVMTRTDRAPNPVNTGQP